MFVKIVVVIYLFTRVLNKVKLSRFALLASSNFVLLEIIFMLAAAVAILELIRLILIYTGMQRQD
ncbi:MAG: hypothetical protein ABF649_06520 [Bacillus sp. (in: firmicutes)]